MKIPYLRLLAVCFLALAPGLARGDEAKYLARGQEALAAFQTLPAQARRSIDIATFIFDTCDTSIQILLETLGQKARQGVKVRVLLDNFSQTKESKQLLAHYAAKHGFEFRFYNTAEKNLRSHIKFLVVDGERYITGGRNLSDKYFGLSAEKNYVDRDLLVTGPTAKQARASFDELWASRNTSRLPGRAAEFKGWRPLCKLDDSARIQTVKQFLDRNARDLLERVPARQCASMRFVTDAPDFADAKYGTGQGGGGHGGDGYLNAQRLARKRVTKNMIAFLANAKTSLRMENWVYMPLFYVSDALAKARENNVRIRAITNRDTEDGPPIVREAMDYAVQKYADRHSVGTQRVRRISAYGAISSAWELTPRKAHFYVHGKTYIRDGRDLVVSSFNLDPRSYNTNLESMVEVRNCPHLAADADDHTTALLATYEDDEKTGRVPPKKEPSLAAKLFANVAFIFF
jgi:phosphatidylserine/phosphatidylglycerophosphate/cardiolipin synthase-like enzyme